MKKAVRSFITCLVILVIFGGAVFFIGWTQLRIKPDCVGVIKSKTSGVQKKPVYPGMFSWNWEFLIPTNADLKLF